MMTTTTHRSLTARPPHLRPPAWRGWIRGGKGEPWTPVAEAPTYEECLAALIAQHGRRHADKIVVRSEDDPNAPRPVGPRLGLYRTRG